MSDDVPRKAAPKMGRRARKDPPSQPPPSGTAGGVPTPAGPPPSGPPPSGPPPGPPRAAVPRAPSGGGDSGPPSDGPPAPPPKVSSGWGLEEGGTENDAPRMNPTASDNVPTGDGSGRRKFGRRGGGGGGGGDKAVPKRSARQDDDSGSDGIPEIPDLEDQEEEEEEDDIIKQVADAPVTRANQVQTLSELDHATKGAVPTARQLDVDISLLTSQLAPPGQLEEDNSLWNYEALFGEVR
eukprot:TRINITY_DN331_c0_g1_i1.p1 TRINITY_DN331_c0_g1~~TRINITY_DN331_c0_g1_i1.p1  ORF type:complete len:239 (-),score=57.36 TRINITY_DN331_c0_g1_i1:382-1098(-)